MTRTGLFAAVAFGGLVLGAAALAEPPIAFRPASAQIRAEQACHGQGIGSNTAAWELCLSHVTRAYEWGEPALAGHLAHVARQASESCLDEGLRVETAGFRSCIDQEIDARSDLLILGDDESGEDVARAQ